MLTMVSFVPFKVRTESPTVIPGSFELEPSDTVKPSTKIVPSDAFYWHDPGMDRPKMQIPVPEQEFARGVVRDYKASQIAIGANAEPALFFVEGMFDSRKHAELVTEHLEKQLNWFKLLVSTGDVDYNAAKGNPLVVSDLQRRAARLLNLERTWLDVDTVNKQCPVCRTNVHPLAIVCRECGNILDLEKYKQFNFAERK